MHSPSSPIVPSLWNAVCAPRKPNACLKGNDTADVTIVGGGFSGLSAALHLAKFGHKVILLEGREIGWGGTGRNNGQVIPVLSGVEPSQIEDKHRDVGERFVHLIANGANFLFDLVRAENIECEAEQTGWFQPAHTKSHMKLSQERVDAWSKHGASVELLDQGQCEKLLGSKQWFGGMLNTSGGHINPLALARGLAACCEKNGVKIMEGSVVEHIEPHNDKWRVKTKSGQIESKAVFMATNAYSNILSPTLEPDVARSVIPLVSWQLATESLDAELLKQIIPGRQAVSDTRADLQFFRLDARNRLVTGAAMIMRTNANNRLRKMVGARLEKTFPQLGAVNFTHAWSGYVGITPDRHPHFHQLANNYWAAIGFNGRGVALSVSIGAQIAKAINGTSLNELALPLSDAKPIAFFPIARKLAPNALTYYRWQDRKYSKG